MNRRQKMKIAGQIGLVILGIAVIYLIVMLIDNRIGIFESDDTDDSYEEEELPIDIDGKIYELSHEMSTYLVMGTDNSGNEEADERKDYVGSMADFMLLLVVDDTDQTYQYIQLNRDTITEVPFLLADGTSYASADIQMCCAHAYGGSKMESCENTEKTVSMFLHGIPIDGYYALKMDAIPELNHAVGGVTVTIEDDFTAIDPEMKPGATLKLSDEQAYTFVHNRMDIGDGENTSRMRRHRAYIHTSFIVEEVPGCLVYGDEDRMIEAGQNILENAIKYGDGRSIWISFSEEEDHVLVSITNTGHTLPQEEMTHIFDSFYRGSNSEQIRGSGLGLYICKELLHKMDGEIFAGTAKDNEFTVTIVLRKI